MIGDAIEEQCQDLVDRVKVVEDRFEEMKEDKALTEETNPLWFDVKNSVHIGLLYAEHLLFHNADLRIPEAARLGRLWEGGDVHDREAYEAWLLHPSKKTPTTKPHQTELVKACMEDDYRENIAKVCEAVSSAIYRRQSGGI